MLPPVAFDLQTATITALKSDAKPIRPSRQVLNGMC